MATVGCTLVNVVELELPALIPVNALLTVIVYTPHMAPPVVWLMVAALLVIRLAFDSP